LGGGYYGNCSGSVPILTLPNSLLQIGIPLMKYSMAVKDYKYKDHGVIPDYNISPTIKTKWWIMIQNLNLLRNLLILNK
jgi:hypothetical protein